MTDVRGVLIGQGADHDVALRVVGNAAEVGAMVKEFVKGIVTQAFEGDVGAGQFTIIL